MKIEINKEYQKQVFEDINNLAYDIYSLAGFIQNDFGRMIEDGTVNKSHIRESIKSMDDSYDNIIEKLNGYRESIRKILEYYS